eukprot:SAG11_NODE_5550_length_1528_cov_1.402379_1_plen_47_part_10
MSGREQHETEARLEGVQNPEDSGVALALQALMVRLEITLVPRHDIHA